MRRIRPFYASLVILPLSGMLAAPARAQPTTLRVAPPRAEVTLPRLVHAIEAEWPLGEAPREDVSVLLDITVNAAGKVTEAKPVNGLGGVFDRAAAAAVLRFEFEPARQGETPIAVRLRYRYAFVAPKQLAPSPPTPAPVSAPTATPVPPESAPIAPATTAEPMSDESYAAVAEIAAAPTEVTRHTVTEQDLTRIPGTSGDALRAIEVMPGVARTSITSGDPILRGAAWHESRSYIEGTTVPLLYHLGGVKSAFNSRLLSRVDLYPGNYRTSFGRGVGGVVSGKVRDPKTDRLHAMGELSVIDSMALIEAPLGKDAAVVLAARRSNIGLFYDAFAPKSSFSVVAVPAYYDYQGLLRVRLSSRHQWRMLAYGSRDALALKFANPSDYDPALRDQVDFGIGYHRQQVALDSELSSHLTQYIQLTYGYTRMKQVFGTVRAEMTEHDLLSRGEWNLRTSDQVRINVGYDLEMLSMSGYYIGERPPQAEGEVMNGGMSTAAHVDLSDLERINAVRPGAYAEVEWRPISPVLLVPGVRFDYYSDQGAWTVDPRLSSRLEVGQRVTLKSGVGLYSQNPQYYELLRGLGNPKLEPYHALKFTAGLEHSPTEVFSWGLDGFYKRLIHRVVSTPGGQEPYFVNQGVGRVYGVELSARYAGERFSGWLAYTLSRSERQDRNEPWRLFELDQTHILAVTGNYRLGRGWEVGGRFRLTSGNPYTPVNSAVYDANVDVYQPINAAPFSARNPLFHQLDARVEKAWQFAAWKLAVYLDLQNVYSAKNYQGFDYSYDYRKRERVAGLSFVPNIGLRGEL